MNPKKTPRQLGYRMPAEWEPHDATWLAWPHNSRDWPGKFAAIPWVYCEIVRLLHVHERVEIIVPDERVETRARRMLARCGVDLAKVGFHRCPTDRSWLRDSAPSFLVNDQTGKVGAACWRFNGWAKYDNWTRDALVPELVVNAASAREWRPTHNRRQVVLEGGAIDVNGQGLLLTTEECLLSETQQRNPDMTRADYETLFRENLGIENTVWLGRGIAGDDTHGHVDDLARFVAPGVVVTVVEGNRADGNYAPLQENLERLNSAIYGDGGHLDVIPLPMPRPIVFDGQRLPASYANFYIANGVVLVPTFNDPADRQALGTLAELFPSREVVGIHSVDFVWGLGTLHCSTQQQPAGRHRA